MYLITKEASSDSPFRFYSSYEGSTLNTLTDLKVPSANDIRNDTLVL